MDLIHKVGLLCDHSSAHPGQDLSPSERIGQYSSMTGSNNHVSAQPPEP